VKTALMTPIGDICQTGSGTTPSRERRDEFYGGSIPWVKSGELRERVIHKTDETVTEAALHATSLKPVPAGALLVAMYGATVGRVGMLGIDATTNQAVCHLIPDPKRVDRKYLFYALRAKAPDLIARSVGGAQPNISQSTIRRTEIYVPPLPAQRRIAAILDEADSVRRAHSAALVKWERLERSLFFNRFGNPLAKHRDSLPLGEHISLVNGRAYKQTELLDKGTPVLRIQNLNGGDRWYYSDLNLPKDKYCDKGDLLFAWSASFGPYIWTGPRAIFHYHIWRLELRPTIEKMYAFWLLNILSDEVKRSGRGISMTHATKGGMEKRMIPVPPIDAQRQFCKEIDHIHHIKALQEEALLKQEALFASLQYRAFRGEL